DPQHQERRLTLVVRAEVADVDLGLAGLAVPRLTDRVEELVAARLADGEGVRRAQPDPLVRLLGHAEEVADDGDAQDRGGRGAEAVGQPAQDRATPRQEIDGVLRLFGWDGGGFHCRAPLAHWPCALPDRHDASRAVTSLTSWSVSGLNLGPRSFVPA